MSVPTSFAARAWAAVLPGLTRSRVLTEVLAGVTLLAIAVPLNIGYSQIAGLPATAGLYSMIVPSVVYALVASTRQVVASPDAAAAALVASSLGGLAAAGSEDFITLAFAQAILCGVFFVLLSVFKLGFLANFLSKPILVGFVGGLALDIMVSQVAKMLGVRIDSGEEFLVRLGQLVSGLATTNAWSVAIAVGSLAVLVGGRRFAPRVPWALVVLVVATSVVVVGRLQARGVRVLGEVEAGAPSLRWPSIGLARWVELIPSALALTLVATTEGLLLARSYSERHGYQTNPDRDLMAYGLGNIASGLTGGFSLGSSTSRSAAMDQAGSRTQLPSIVAAVGTLILLLVGTALLFNIPSAAIGAIVAVAILPLIGVRELRDLWRLERAEFAVAGVCFLVTLLVGPIAGIAVAFILSLIVLTGRAARPPIAVLSGDGVQDGTQSPVTAEEPLTAPGLVILRFAAPVFFANGTGLGEAARAAVEAPGAGTVRRLVLDMEAVTDVDVTGAESMQLLRNWLDDHQVSLGYSRVRPELYQRLDHFGLLNGAQVHRTNHAAITNAPA